MSEKSTLEETFDVGKKGFDFIDDAYNACRGFLPNTTFLREFGTFLIASVSFVIHAGEAVEAIHEFHANYKDKNAKYRTAKMLTGGLIIGCTLSGVGLAVTYGIGHLSAIGTIGAVSISAFTMAMIPVLLPGLLLGAYGLYLARKFYILHEAKKEAKAAEDGYRLPKDNALPLAERGNNIFKTSRAYQDAHKIKLEAEKEAALGTLEVTASALVTTGIALSSAATIGAVLGLSVISFGVVPMVLMATGVAIGLGSKIFEHLDDRKEGKYTQGLRNFFRKSFSLPEDDPMKINPSPTENRQNMQHISQLLPKVTSTSNKVKEEEPSLYRKLFVPSPEARKKQEEQFGLLYNSGARM